MKAKLILASKDGETSQDVPFDRSSITIGRKPSNDLAFNRPEISGSHAAFLFENNQYFVMDLGSTNGTLLNGAQLVAREKYGLQDKDVVTVAPYTIQFVMEDESMDTMIEVSAQPVVQKKRSGTAPDLANAAIVKEAQPREVATKQPELSANKPPAPDPVQPKAESPAPAPIPTINRPPASAPSSRFVVAETKKAPSAVTDYLWLGIGAILVLAAIGLIVYIFVGL